LQLFPKFFIEVKFYFDDAGGGYFITFTNAVYY
jgi:hypothetical protein